MAAAEDRSAALPVRRFAHFEFWLTALAFNRVVSSQGAADSLVYHRQAFVRKTRIIHSPSHEKAAAEFSQRRLICITRDPSRGHDQADTPQLIVRCGGAGNDLALAE
jgi:hypothetical protein